MADMKDVELARNVRIAFDQLKNAMAEAKRAGLKVDWPDHPLQELDPKDVRIYRSL